jgi:hypothetical protein
MFVYVRLIDSQEHQYPKKTRSKHPVKNQKQDPKIQKNHRPTKPGIQDPKKNREKTNVPKNQVPESINQGKLKSRSALNPGIL